MTPASSLPAPNHRPPPDMLEGTTKNHACLLDGADRVPVDRYGSLGQAVAMEGEEVVRLRVFCSLKQEDNLGLTLDF